MTECKKQTPRQFEISCLKNGYPRQTYILNVEDSTTIETAWLSEKCWFVPCTTVIIRDDRGNEKTFIKEWKEQ